MMMKINVPKQNRTVEIWVNKPRQLLKGISRRKALKDPDYFARQAFSGTMIAPKGMGGTNNGAYEQNLNNFTNINSVYVGQTVSDRVIKDASTPIYNAAHEAPRNIFTWVGVAGILASAALVLNGFDVIAGSIGATLFAIPTIIINKIQKNALISNIVGAFESGIRRNEPSIAEAIGRSKSFVN